MNRDFLLLRDEFGKLKRNHLLDWQNHLFLLKLYRKLRSSQSFCIAGTFCCRYVTWIFARSYLAVLMNQFSVSFCLFPIIHPNNKEIQLV
ncbi:hypothetical protein ZOSMA_165G00010 [Zostera marina]|uniref:Uncharacterized protein n=1 Tax=Zostera marina TaxID=29655 RepID=A0A0K9PTK4_ZOSMR|nr:hypothetical protein ZOSMA_165G00010 [Zostera marina]